MHGCAVFLPISLLALLLILQRCSGGDGSSGDPANKNDTDNTNNPVDTTSNGYSGSEVQAAINENNAKDLAISAASGRLFNLNRSYIDVSTDIPFTQDCTNECMGFDRLSFTGLS